MTDTPARNRYAVADYLEVALAMIEQSPLARDVALEWRAEARAAIAAAPDLLAECRRLRYENAALREVLEKAAEGVRRLAFDMPPPNQYTPQFVQLSQEMTRAALKAVLKAALAEGGA